MTLDSKYTWALNFENFCQARAQKLQSVQNELGDETVELQHASDYFKTLRRDI